jgi:hypothetical protein
MNPERFGELVAELWRAVEAGDPYGVEAALMELKGSIAMAIMPAWGDKQREKAKKKAA